MNYEVVDGDLLSLPVDAIVNAWNRNVVPWWLLLPQGYPVPSSGVRAHNPFVSWREWVECRSGRQS